MRMDMNREKQAVSGSAFLLLSVIFAFCMAAVLLAGAQIYTKQTKESTLLWEKRTCGQFLSTKLRQADPQNLSIRDFGDGDALSIGECSEYGEFETLVYCHEGMLKELFTVPGAGEPTDGEPIAPAMALKLSKEGGLILADLMDSSGAWTSLRICIRGAEE